MINYFIYRFRYKMKLTEEEHNYIAEYVRITYGVEDVSSRKMKKKRCEIFWKISDYIDRYGEDGMGNKPKDMNRVVYWLSHIDLD